MNRPIGVKVNESAKSIVITFSHNVRIGRHSEGAIGGEIHA